MGLEPLGKRRKEFAKGEGSQSRASGCERVIGWPKAGEGFGFFGFGSTNMPRRRRWGRTPCQNHFALDVWGNWRVGSRGATQ